MLHYDIVPVCINTDVAALFQGPVQAEGRCTFYISGGSDAVDDSVTGVIDPFTFVDAHISRISPFFIIESSNDLILFCADITVPLSDVIQNQLWRRISVLDVYKRQDLESIDSVKRLKLFGYYWHIGKLLSNCIQVRMN